jgi:hypothetical protein
VVGRPGLLGLILNDEHDLSAAQRIGYRFAARTRGRLYWSGPIAWTG